MKQCHLKKLKRVKDIDGNLISSVRVGRIAVLAVGGKVIHTSRVVKVHTNLVSGRP